MDIQKVTAAHGEMRDCYRLLAAGIQIKQDAESRLLGDSPLSNHEWMVTAAEYAAITAEVHRLHARIAVLKGRIHFEAQTI